FAGAFSKYQKIGERIAAETICAVDPGCAFPGSKQPRETRHLGVGINAHAAHDVVGGWSNLHRLLCDVDVCQLFELMIHAWKFSLNVFGGLRHFLFDPRNIEINAAVRTSPALFDLSHDAARHVITR